MVAGRASISHRELAVRFISIIAPPKEIRLWSNQTKTSGLRPRTESLGVLIPGIGAVTTTFIAGVEAVKRGLGQPIGSLTQLATIRLGKRTDGRTPMIKDFVPLAGLDDLVFGGWDIFEDTAYEAAVERQGAGQCRCSNS